jgi:hypothetical protein
MYTKYGIAVISLYSFNSVEFDFFAPTSDAALLISTHVVEFVGFLEVFTWFHVLHCAILGVGAGRLRKVEGFDFC